MIKFIAKIILFLILFGNLNAQNHLNRSNLITLCNCDPSFSIFITYKSIKTIDPTTFNGLSTLHQLHLCYNQISFIHRATFRGLTSLTLLNLNDNQISSLDQSTFNGLVSLRSLSLYSNKILTIDAAVFNGLTVIQSIRLCGIASNEKSQIDTSWFTGTCVETSCLTICN